MLVGSTGDFFKKKTVPVLVPPVNIMNKLDERSTQVVTMPTPQLLNH